MGMLVYADKKTARPWNLAQNLEPVRRHSRMQHMKARGIRLEVTLGASVCPDIHVPNGWAAESASSLTHGPSDRRN